MSGTVVIGSQWGDEGKGKIVDALCSSFDYVVRYQGGANAGHTLKVSGKKIILHLVPSGILHPHVQCIIASGVALDIFGLAEEIQSLKKLGYLKENKQLKISGSSSLLLDYHKQMDQARESFSGSSKIGTTGRGIGPAYEDRISRKGLIFSDLFSKNNSLKEKLQISFEEKFFVLSKFYGVKTESIDDLFERLKLVRESLYPYFCKNVSSILHRALDSGKKVLFEGAQGALLDIFHGSYPYVTSSSTLAGSALTGSGVGWTQVDSVLGVMKAYTTRVGFGPFPSECDGESAKHLEEKGQERGSTTNRRRRCGWLDLAALKYSMKINGVNRLALMKLDVLSGLKTVKICMGYSLGEGELDLSCAEDFSKGRAVYKEFSGWEKLGKSLEEFPPQAREYIQFIENQLGLPIDIISLGPSREETIFR